MQITRFQPDVNKSVFDLYYDRGELQKVEIIKADSIHEGLTAQEAFEQTKADCIAKTELNQSIAESIETDKVEGAYNVFFNENRELIVETDNQELKAYLTEKSYPIINKR